MNTQPDPMKSSPKKTKYIVIKIPRWVDTKVSGLNRYKLQYVTRLVPIRSSLIH